MMNGSSEFTDALGGSSVASMLTVLKDVELLLFVSRVGVCSRVTLATITLGSG